MGTNYYIEGGPKCQHCGRGPGEPMHIGKQSAGWQFSLRGHPDLQTWQEWRQYLLAIAGTRVVNEYGDTYSTWWMIQFIENSRTGLKDRGCNREDSEGYQFHDGEFC